MFSFLQDMDNYEERKVDRYEKDDLIIDTCFASDIGKYETAIQHPQYDKGKWIITEEYETESLAKIGHEKWVKIMTSEKLPGKLINVSSACAISILRDCFNENLEHEKTD